MPTRSPTDTERAANCNATEQSPLLTSQSRNHHRPAHLRLLSSGSLAGRFSTEERALGVSGVDVGERLPYNDYSTIDWLHDLVCHLRHFITAI